jgi:hypothetical protein
MTDPANPPAAPIKQKPRWRRWGVRIAIVMFLALIGGELFARFYLGLGDPPLSMAVPKSESDLEYLFKPDQDCHRFGNHIKYNHYSMRSDEFTLHKTNLNELRVLVVGDSVINGGVLTDQPNTVSEILQKKLAEDLKRPVLVGNVSAGSWGPPNELAYLKQYGLFDADVIVIVLSSHDYVDVPTWEPVVGVNHAYPAHKPFSALWEGFERYLLPKLRHKSISDEAFVPNTGPVLQKDIDWCMTSLREMIEMSRKQGAKVLVAQYLERDETLASPLPGHDIIARESKNDGVEPIELGPAAAAARSQGENPYRDSIHPNDAGQRIIATTLLPAIEKSLQTPATHP